MFEDILTLLKVEGMVNVFEDLLMQFKEECKEILGIYLRMFFA